ncbi:MAG TPA: LacI family transcriptional regulator [Firmicutes bacterium]|nr:LacI family transcriptional regulator [Bacillota bacterium]
MNTTMKDIAKIAGVSINTVSRALNDKPEINEKTRRRIKRIARELNYTPNSIAASLASRKTKTIGLIIPDICDPFFAQQARGVEDTAKEEGYSVILLNTDEISEAELKAVATLRSIRVAGLMLTSVFPGTDHIENLNKQKVPLVLLNRRCQEIDTNYVINDNQKGAYKATKHLIKLGHKKIGVILGPQRITSVLDRYVGYKKAMAEAGIELSEKYIVYGENLKPSTGEILAEQLLRNNPRPTAILAYCDSLAIGAYAAARNMGLSIPEELALVGYDDIPYAQYFEIPLTTVAQPAYNMGKAACKIILEKIKLGGDEKDLESQHIVFEPELVIRKSCGAQVQIESSWSDY